MVRQVATMSTFFVMRPLMASTRYPVSLFELQARIATMEAIGRGTGDGGICRRRTRLRYVPGGAGSECCHRDACSSGEG